MAGQREDQAVKHEEQRVFEHELGYVVSACTCGATWSHPKNRAFEEMNSIFASHVKYFENKTVVL